MDAETQWWRDRALLLERRLLALGEEVDFDLTPPPREAAVVAEPWCAARHPRGHR